MKIPLMKRKSEKPTPAGVIQSQLAKAYGMHPARLMPSTVVAALEEAGYLIMSNDQISAEVELAFQAGRESAEDAS